MKKLILGSLVAIAFTLFGVTNAGASEFKSGMLLASSHSDSGKCGSGKCGGEKKSKCGHGKCGEGKKSKCGQGKCGGDMKNKNCKNGDCKGKKGKCGGEPKGSKCGQGKCGS